VTIKSFKPLREKAKERELLSKLMIKKCKWAEPSKMYDNNWYKDGDQSVHHMLAHLHPYHLLFTIDAYCKARQRSTINYEKV